jgi:hypothetical protein
MDRPIPYELHIPPPLKAGVYSNHVMIWHTPYEFTVDFIVAESVRDTDEGPKIPCQLVSRVKIPVALMFDVIRRLNTEMTSYELIYGEIVRPEARPNGEEEG